MTHALITVPTADQPRADAGGWDLVLATTIGQINAAIAEAGTSPKAFNIQIDADTHAAGQFAPWRIATEGDGPLLHLIVPLSEVRIEGDHLRTTAHDIECRFECQLAFRPSGSRDGRARERHLVVDLDTPLPHRNHKAPVCLIGMDGAEGFEPQHRALLEFAVEMWMTQHLHQFTHVFAVIRMAGPPDRASDPAAFGWLSPKSATYAARHNSRQPDQSVLAILCETSENSTSAHAQLVAPGLIPPGCGVGICIDRLRVLQDLIGVSLVRACPGATEDDLVFATREGRVTVRRDPDDAGPPHIAAISVTLCERELRVTSTVRTKIGDAPPLVCAATATYGFGLLETRRGTATLGLTHPRPVDTARARGSGTGGSQMATLQSMAEASADDVALGLLVMLLDGALPGPVPARSAERIKTGAGPSLARFLSAANATVEWCTGPIGSLRFAALNYGFQFGGDATPGAARAFQTRHPDATGDRLSRGV